VFKLEAPLAISELVELVPDDELLVELSWVVGADWPVT
jgi:hypothetical protein